MTQTEPREQRARTKIVATVGPACCSRRTLRELIEAGVDVFRLNMAHGDRETHEVTLTNLRELSEEIRPVAVLVDLAGPKIRLGELPGDLVHCHEGSELRFVRGLKSERPDELVSNYEKLIDELDEGDDVLLADGTVSMVVVRSDPNSVTCRVTNGGAVRTKQGINLPGAKISLPAMTEKDRDCANWAAARKVDFVSLSFVRTPQEIIDLKGMLAEQGSTAPVIAKIEKPEALENLDAIVEVAGGIMVARGDLGVEIDVARVPIAQKRIIETCNRLQKPVIVATQMLDSMQHSSRPTRAEVTDVANAILDGADACMLSGETAIGEHPKVVVETMNRVMMETEQLLESRPARPPADRNTTGVTPITDAVVYGAARIAERVKAKLVVVATRSGITALTKSSQRDFIPTVAVSRDPAVLRRLCLYWGIVPLTGDFEGRVDVRNLVFNWGKADGLLENGDFVVVVMGSGVEQHAHNLVVVHQVE